MENPPTLDQLFAEEEQQKPSALKQRLGEMPLLDHLDELRGMLIRVFAVFILASTLIAVFIKLVADFLRWPLDQVLPSDDPLVAQGLKTDGPWAVFSVLFQVTFLGGLALSLPLILYFVARFVAPGLTQRELKMLRPICLSAFGLFLGGASFAFFVLIPATLKAAVFFNELFRFQVLWSADKYYSTLTWMTIGVGMLFEFPLLEIGLVTAGVLTVESLKKYRSHAVVFFLAAAAMITPSTDPVTFLLLAVPMWLLHEAAIILAGLIERKRLRELETA